MCRRCAERAVRKGRATAFQESALPFKVDVVDWASTAEGFRRIIEAERVVLGID